MAKGGGTANKSYLFQETKALLNEKTLLPWFFEKMKTLGTAACPPYHLAVVIGGTSAEMAVETAKLASARYLDTLPTRGLDRSATRSATSSWSRRCSRSRSRPASARSSAASTSATTCASSACRATAPSCPVGIAVSCSADRQALGKITRDGIFLEQLETDPAHFLPDVERRDAPRRRRRGDVVHIDLTRPMTEIRAELAQAPGEDPGDADRADRGRARHRPRQVEGAARRRPRAARST